MFGGDLDNLGSPLDRHSRKISSKKDSYRDRDRDRYKDTNRKERERPRTKGHP